MSKVKDRLAALSPRGIAASNKRRMQQARTKLTASEKAAQRRIDALNNIKDEHTRKLAKQALEPILKSLSVLDALNDVHKVIRRDLGYQGVQLDTSVLTGIVEGVLTVALARKILWSANAIPVADKRTIMDRIIKRYFPIEQLDKKKAAPSAMSLMRQLMGGVTPQPLVPPLGARSKGE